MKNHVKIVIGVGLLSVLWLFACANGSNSGGNDTNGGQDYGIASCGNGQCEPGNGENCKTCAPDCGCASGMECNDQGKCVTAKCVCGDGKCDAACNENLANCPQDCGCQPNCAGKDCGDDGCGGICGSCGSDRNCVQGKCVSKAQCGNGKCDPSENCSTCPGDCTCGAGSKCYNGVCCKPKTCSELYIDCGTADDECGGTLDCGTCSSGQTCISGTCSCAYHDHKRCNNGDVWWYDSCGNKQDVAAKCSNGCKDAHCLNCQPDCTGKNCGDDGCGGSCGQCGGNEQCVSGQCKCVPQCKNKQCGDDGCGGSCGQCGGNEQCLNGHCKCVPDCTGKECGDDGCGGSCGQCIGGEVCVSSKCQCKHHDHKACSGKDLYWFDSCGSKEDLAKACGYKCSNGKCIDQCQPNCQGRECGADGCGGSCGSCASGLFCTPDGHCTDQCVPNCAGKSCGSDGCGGSCGDCGPAKDCLQGKCQCLPYCPPYFECGPDRCGGSCGSCGDGFYCDTWEHVCKPVDEGCKVSNGRTGCDGCECETTVCNGNSSCCSDAWGSACADACSDYLCQDQECGTNECGKSCGRCPAGETCNALGKCVACLDDRCGGDCGGCDSDEVCDYKLTSSDYGLCQPKENDYDYCKNSEQMCGENGECGDCPDGQFCFDWACVSNPKTWDFAKHAKAGCCIGDTLFYVDVDDLKVANCKALGKHCGWNPQKHVYDCVASASADPSGHFARACLSGCTGSCSGKECGPDGCGGSCGSCESGQKCVNGQCKTSAGCGDGVCYQGENCANCPQDCKCKAGEVCSADGKCGDCASDADCISMGVWTRMINQKCVNGKCKCEPFTCQDLGAQCGKQSDGCNNTLDCGKCTQYPNSYCLHGKCECKPDSKWWACGNVECGKISDGCDGSLDCGECGANQACVNNKCYNKGWNLIDITDPDVQNFAHIGMDKNSTVHILYKEDANSKLVYGDWQGVQWDRWNIDFNNLNSTYATRGAINYTKNNRPVISFDDEKLYVAYPQDNDARRTWLVRQVFDPHAIRGYYLNDFRAFINKNNELHLIVDMKEDSTSTGVNSDRIYDVYFPETADQSNFNEGADYTKILTTDMVSDMDFLDGQADFLGCIAARSFQTAHIFVMEGSVLTSVEEVPIGGGLSTPEFRCRIAKNPVTGNVEVFYATKDKLKVAIKESGTWKSYVIASNIDGPGNGVAMGYTKDGDAWVLYSANNKDMTLYKFLNGAWSHEDFAVGEDPEIQVDKNGKFYVLYREKSGHWRFGFWFGNNICVDKDHDGYGDGCVLPDCDDNNVNIHPGATDVCNGKDDDCDGQTDEDTDVDGDGFKAIACGGLDCNDKYKDVNPDQKWDVCGDGLDQDCDGKNPDCAIRLYYASVNHIKVTPDQLYLPRTHNGSCAKISVTNDTDTAFEVGCLGFSGGGYVLAHASGTFTACGDDYTICFINDALTLDVNLEWKTPPSR